MIILCIFTILFIPSIRSEVVINCNITNMEFETGIKTTTCISSPFVYQNESEPVNISNGNESIQGLYVEKSNSAFIPLDLANSLPSLKYFVFVGSNLTQVSQNSLKNLKELIEVKFNKNSLTKIEAGTFDDNPKLQKIILSSNKIDSIDNCSFAGLRDLRELHLNDNSFTTLGAGLFQDNRNLLVIKLQFNSIKELPVTLFHGLRQLNTLQLDFNELQALPDRMFVDCEDLKSLTVSFNAITRIGTGLLDKFGLTSFRNNDCTSSRSSEEIESTEDVSATEALEEKCKATCEDQRSWLEQEINEIRSFTKCGKNAATGTSGSLIMALKAPAPTTEIPNDASTPVAQEETDSLPS